MSWFARSLASSLMTDSDHDHRRGSDEQEEETHPHSHGSPDGGRGEEEDEDEDSPGRRIKEDISELTKTLSRQFWGVASFLAPPPDSPAPDDGRRLEQADDTDDPLAAIAGIRSDLAEIGGKFRSGISRLSGHKAVSEISKIASTFLPFGPEEEMEEGEEEEDGSGWKAGGSAVGVTEEVLAFVRNISMHPETWLDFPLLPEEEESDDFDMSDAQQEHALTVERLAPRLAALRIELCPSHISEGCFWKIYFVLLHPRLNKHDAELLSTPQIVEARAMLHSVQNRRMPQVERPTVDVSHSYADDASAPTELQVTTVKEACEPEPRETEKHPVQITEVNVVDKSVIAEEPSGQPPKDLNDASHVPIQKLEDGDEWLEEDPSEVGTSGSTAIPLGDDEDVSFSDLEEDDDRIGSVGYKAVPSNTSSQVTVTTVRGQLNKAPENSANDDKSEEADDWPDADDI